VGVSRFVLSLELKFGYVLTHARRSDAGLLQLTSPRSGREATAECILPGSLRSLGFNFDLGLSSVT
jgi:hypothetical protein